MASVWVAAGHETAAQMGERVIHVADGVIGHARPLAGGETVADALRDYASGYQDADEEVVVTWVLFVDGVESDYGHEAFSTKPEGGT